MVTKATIDYLNKDAIEFIRKYNKNVNAQLKSRVGYVESDHTDEVLKGADMAATIIQDNMVDAIRSLLSTNKHQKDQLDYHETQRKKLAQSLQYVMSSIEFEYIDKA